MRVHVYGYCELEPPEIERLGFDQIRELQGNYVLAIESPDSTTLISAAEGVWPHYYALVEGRLYHGPTVLDVLRRSGLAWKWNWRALSDVILNEHTLEDETLHPEIHRVPAAAVLTFAGGKLTIDRRTWDGIHPHGTASASHALTVLNGEVSRWATPTSSVAMSGGFDSRLLLSSLLRHQHRPRLVSMGFEDSTDVIIAGEIARTLELPFMRVELEARDFVDHAKTIAGLTGGTKPAVHWHTYISTQKAGLESRDRFFIGSNGEFCRSFLLDKGIASRLADGLPTGVMLRSFWKLKFKSPFRESELSGMPEPLARQFGSSGRDEWVDRRVALCAGAGFLSGLDKFYLTQRVRHFIGNGLLLYSANCTPITPMCSSKWASVVWNLDRSWKQGSGWHRFAIHENYPKLMEFPEERVGQRMSLRPKPFYWLGRKSAVVPYHRYDQWFRHGPIIDFLRDNVSLLSDVMDGSQVRRICDEHQASNSRQRAIAFFITVIAWKQAMAAR